MSQLLNQQNFQVIIRVRPLNLKQQQQIQLYEAAQNKKFKNSSNNKMIKLSPTAYSFYTKFYNVANLSDIMKVQQNTVFVIDTEYKNSDKKMKPFQFSNVYSQKQTSQQIFNLSIFNQVNCIFQGYNYTILAYGITGSGKTHTVFGSHQKNQKGVCGLALNYLLKKKKQLEKNGKTKVNLGFSFVQIYNQNVRDLLNSQGKMLNIVEDAKGNTSFTDAIQIQIHNHDQIHDLINIGLAKRSSGATMANQYSSRSHAILQMNVEIISQNSKINSKLFIIDLAGSQKIQTLNSAKKMQQGANINKSLLSLGNCINILAQSSKKGLNGSTVHIPYRDSKLTRILKDSLGGNAKTLMISCISENPFTIQQTITTLNYAQRAQGIKKQIKKNRLYQEQQHKLCIKCMKEMNGQCQVNINSVPSKLTLPPHLTQLNSSKDEMFETIFSQIYEDIIQNIKQKCSIQKIISQGKIKNATKQQIQNIRQVNENQKNLLKQTMLKLFNQKQQDYYQKISELNQFISNYNQKQQKIYKSQLKTKLSSKKSDNQNLLTNSNIHQNNHSSLTKRAPKQKCRSISVQRKPLKVKDNNYYPNFHEDNQEQYQKNYQKPHESIKFLLQQASSNRDNETNYLPITQEDNARFSFASLLTADNNNNFIKNDVNQLWQTGNTNNSNTNSDLIINNNIADLNEIQNSQQRMTKRKKSRSKFQVVKRMSASKTDSKQFIQVSL